MPGTAASGNEAMLVDRMTEGSTSFQIDKVSIEDGAELSIAAHKRTASNAADEILCIPLHCLI